MPHNSQDMKASLARLIEDSAAQLRGVEAPSFSTEGLSELKEYIGRYVLKLVTEAVKLATDHSPDAIVSRTEVRRANDRIIWGTPGRAARLLGTIGGVLLGVGLSGAFSMLHSGSYSAVGMLLVLGFLCVGVFMVAYDLGSCR